MGRRGAGPRRCGAGVSLAFAVRNAGKRGVVLDLADEADVVRFHELLDHADVLVTSGADAGAGPRRARPRHAVTRTSSSAR